MVPEERCKNVRVNPKPVFKEMKRKICRTPRSDVSSYDRQLVRRLQMWAESISHEDKVEYENTNDENRSISQSLFENNRSVKRSNDIVFP